MDQVVPNGWLSEEEIILHRMLSFHQRRIDEAKDDISSDGHERSGKMLIHCIPEQAVISRKRYAARQLKEHGRDVRPPNSHYSNPRFNADGFASSDSPTELRTYSQLYRDGRLEAVLARATFSREKTRFLSATACECAILETTKQYLKFCKAIGISPPIWLFCALVDVEGAKRDTDWDEDVCRIDRPVVELPEIDLAALDIDVSTHLRPLLDCVWNAMGLEQSPNYDQQGNRREQQEP